MSDRTLIRLNKWIADAGICSRREADRLIDSGKVTVNGLIAVTGQKVAPDDHIEVDGKTASPEKERIILAVNKPVGVVCTSDRRWGDTLLEDIVRSPKRVFSIGRLDKDSEGLILMTNRGDLLNKIMKAGNYHEKEYLVIVDRPVTPQFLEKISQGVYLPELNATTRPCKIRKSGEKSFHIILTQGLNRQIRRMCEAFGYHVVKLKRLRIMNIELGDLPSGKCRPLTKKETAVLLSSLDTSVNNTEHRWNNGKTGQQPADRHMRRTGEMHPDRRGDYGKKEQNRRTGTHSE